MYVKGEGCQEQNQASQRDTAVAGAGWGGGWAVYTCALRERSPHSVGDTGGLRGGRILPWAGLIHLLQDI